MARAGPESCCLLEAPSQLEEAREIVEAVRAVGLSISDRYSGPLGFLGFGKHSNCFPASELVDVLLALERANNRQEAVRLGQLLVDTDLMHHVTDKLEFVDGSSLYAFREDEGESKGPSAAAIRQLKGSHCGYVWKKGMMFWSKYYMALSCPASHKLLLYRQDLDSSPLSEYSFSEAVLQPEVTKECLKLTIYLTLLDGVSVTLLIGFKSEEELFGWTAAFGSNGSKVLDAIQPDLKACAAKNIYDFTVTDIEGKEFHLEQFRGQVALIVNVASS